MKKIRFDIFTLVIFAELLVFGHAQNRMQQNSNFVLSVRLFIASDKEEIFELIDFEKLM